MLLSFPYMHTELVAGDIVPGLCFFDPGIGMVDGDRKNIFRPDDLPLAPKTATALINDCINFGEQFKDPSEMAYFGVMTPDEFYEGSSRSIRAQLTQRFVEGQGVEGQRIKADRESSAAASSAQFVLLLAWSFEEKIIQLQGIERGVKDSWESIDTTLGMDEEDRINERLVGLANTESHTRGISDGQVIPLPWKRVIEALPAFIPSDTVLVCSDRDIIAVWDELEIEFLAADKQLGLPEGAQEATLPAWKFAGRRKPPEGLPLALCEITVAVIR